MKTWLCTSCLIFLIATGVAFGQASAQPCGPPPVILQSTQPNIFSEQQELWLGDAMADLIENRFRPVRNEALNIYLDTIANRLLSGLPPTKTRFRLMLVESSEINGFSLAGGRIYLTRKLIANAQNEDEVAGVIAHEMGHILTHQFAFETTANLRRLLGITSVGDKADIYSKFQKLVEAEERDKHAPEVDTDEKQDEADRVGVYALAAAGYHPQAYAELWDRSFFVGGKTGNRFSDLFGATKPNQKRLRQMQKLVAVLPPGCGAATVKNGAAFQRWHDDVVANQEVKAEAPVKSNAVVQLTPPLRMDVERLRFSRDGNSILAQDESSIFVLSREPFKTLFRVSAEGALSAEFSPDSQQINFSTPGLHVEQWSVSQQKLIAAHEVVAPQGCLQSILSPDGRTILCVMWSSEVGSDLKVSLLDVETGQIVNEHKSWFHPDFYSTLRLLLSQAADISEGLFQYSFSADGNAILFGQGTVKLAYNLKTRTPINLSNTLQMTVTGAYAFEGSDKLAGISSMSSESGIFSFPDGRRLAKTNLYTSNMQSVSAGDVVLVRDLKDYAVGVANLNTGKLMMTSKVPAFDIFNEAIVTENPDGSLLLAKIADNQASGVESLMLPLSPLGGTKTAEISPDGRYLAYSSRTRGAIWDLTSGQRVFLSRGFRHAFWTTGNTILAEFREYMKEDPIIGEMTMAPKAAKSMPYKLEKNVHLEGGLLLEWKSEGRKSWQLVVHNPNDNSSQWNRTFTEKPEYTTNRTGDSLLFIHSLKSADAKEELRQNPALKAQADALMHKEDGLLIVVVNPANGTTLKQAVIEAPAHHSDRYVLIMAGDLFFLSETNNRTYVYSAATGLQLREMFGEVVASDAVSQTICTTNRRNEAVVYDRTGLELKHFKLESPLRFVSIQKGGKELLVLTADQQVARFDLNGAVGVKGN